MRPQIDQVVPNTLIVHLYARACSRRVERLNIEERQVDWTFVLFMFFAVLHCPILEVPWLQNT